ncbi:MAG: TrkA family potassium uptake protein [Chloroflexaceae bacterium]|nr:TrkA family potassium uptake protein [Chloroflexaceae bacterium]
MINSDIYAVLRIFNDDLVTNLENTFGHNTAFSSSALAAPTMAAVAVSSSVKSVVPLTSGLLGLAEITIANDSHLTGFASKIEEAYSVRVLQYCDSQGHWQWLRSGHRITGGDTVLMLGPVHMLEHAREQNRSGSKFEHITRATPLEHFTDERNLVIVCGLGRVGYRMIYVLATRIRPRPEIVVICHNETRAPFIEAVQALGAKVVKGDARLADVLRAAGVQKAYSLAAVTSDNLVNIQIALTARRLAPAIDVVLRVFSDVLTSELEQIFGPNTVFSTSALAAPTIAAAAVDPDIRYVVNMGGRLLSSVELVLHRESELVGKTVHQVYEQDHVIVILLHRQGQRQLLPPPTTPLQANDEVVIMVEIDKMAQLRAMGQPSRVATPQQLVATRTQRLDNQSASNP